MTLDQASLLRPYHQTTYHSHFNLSAARRICLNSFYENSLIELLNDAMKRYAVLLWLFITLTAEAQKVITTPNGGTLRSYTDQDGLPSNDVSQVIETSDGYLWAATSRGIVRFNGYEFETVGKDYGVPDMRYICYDRKREHLWFASPEALVQYDGKIFRRYTARNGYKLAASATSITAMYVDSKGTLWIGAQGIDGGLTKFENGVFNVLDKASFPLPNMAYPLQSVRLIYESLDGTLWFGGSGKSENGIEGIGACLARYSRESGTFEVMDSSKGFPFENLFGIDQDKDGNTWFFCRGRRVLTTGEAIAHSGVARFDGKTFQTFPDVAARLNNGVRVRNAIIDKERNDIYVSLTRGYSNQLMSSKETESSVIRFRNGIWETVKIADAAALDRLSGAKDNRNPTALYSGYSFVTDASGALYAQLERNVREAEPMPLYALNKGTWTFIDMLSFRISPQSNTFPKNTIDFLRSGGLIVGTYGYNAFFPGNRQFISAQSGLLKNTIGSFFTEKRGNPLTGEKIEGNVWLIYDDTWDKRKGKFLADGLSVWNGEKFYHFTTKDGLTSNAVQPGFLQDAKGRIWIPTDKGVTLAEYANDTTFDPQTLRFKPVMLPSGKAFDASHIIERHNGDIWAYHSRVQPALSTLNAPPIPFFLGTFNGKSFDAQPNPFPDSLTQKPFHQYLLTEDRFGTLWLIGRFSDLAERLDTARTTIRVLLKDDTAWREPPKEWDMPTGNAQFIGTTSFGEYFFFDSELYVFNLKKFKKVTNTEFGTLLRRLHRSRMMTGADVRGDTIYVTFWGYGVFEIAPKRIRFFDKKNGLPTQDIAVKYVAANKDVLFNSPLGVVVFNGSSFRLIKSELLTISPRDVQLSKDKHGAFMMAYDNAGVAITKMYNERLTMTIESLRADTLSFSAFQTPALSFDKSDVKFRFVAVSLRAPEETRYTYRLDGYDDEWSSYTTARTADYKNLPDGSYTFRVKAVGASGIETSEASMRFTVEPPYWKTWWFISLMSASVFALGFVGYQWRIKKIEEKNQALTRLVAERTQEIERKNLQLEQKSRDVQALSEIGQKIAAALSLETLTSTVFANVNQLMDADAFGIGIYNAEKEEILYKSFIDMGVKLPEFRIQLTDLDRPAVWCVTHKKDVFINDFEKEYSKYVEKLPEPRAAGQPKSLLFCPLMVETRVIGVITVQSYKAQAYTSYHLDILKTLASHTAIALDNANAYETLHQAMNNLKETQAQLVHAEKMASLGELTAGIAHEIQNPLNFVNNFSELSADLMKELEEEVKKTPQDKDIIAELIADLSANMEKIAHHGKRASSIVKGMLEHSRKSSGERQAVDLNALLDEYLKLAYHGYRAKDAQFNAKLTTDFDQSLPTLLVAPQDLSRVFLNLFNNGLYSAYEKAKQQGDGFMPELQVRTKNLAEHVEIRIRDNGNGIAQAALGKIFQPFFTTKPTGQGTGLGLSISYDIITKQHGGKLTVDTKENEFAEFIIRLPKTQCAT